MKKHEEYTKNKKKKYVRPCRLNLLSLCIRYFGYTKKKAGIPYQESQEDSPVQKFGDCFQRKMKFRKYLFQFAHFQFYCIKFVNNRNYTTSG